VNRPRRPEVARNRSPDSPTHRIERLAPTGEGVARDEDGVGFVERALPGELVETNVYQVRKSFWRGTVRAVREPSPSRVSGAHADCAGCDWAHFEAGAAREAKRDLFLETLRRIGRIEPSAVPRVDVAASPPAYRLRSRFHVSGRGREASVGYYEPHSHRVAGAELCEALSDHTRALLPRLRDAVDRSEAAVSAIAILEAPDPARRLLLARVDAAGGVEELADALAPFCDGVRVRASSWDASSRTTARGDLAERGARRLAIEVGGRALQASAGAFFQGNRHLLGPLHARVAEAAAEAPAGAALDAYGGVGLFAGALLSGGRSVVSVEGDAEAAACAREARSGWADGERWTVAEEPVADFLARDAASFACVVVDPPRAGLGRGLAAELAGRCDGRLVYVSCDPATLARDLAEILPLGFRLSGAALYDLFAFTHRIEAVVTLDRAA
jgi:tRNA/tmRNA/rRNA uracil-C5-methylase (TrmA/RlmC/RlmD family)